MDNSQPSASNSVANTGDENNLPSGLMQNLQKRQCWVCFGTEQDDLEGQEVIWVCPCKCKGTMKWVHEDCLQRWIDEKQKRTNSMRVSCSQCKTHYILSFPPASRFIRLIEQYDKLLYGSSPFVAVSVVLGSMYLCCASYGFISIIQFMGYDDGRRLIYEADPLLIVIGLPVVPVTLILAKLIKWEDFILRVWKRSAYNIPRPLSYFIDKPPLRPRANCDQILMDPSFNEPLGCTRMICGALLLPTVSALFGKIFFSKVSGTPWRRSLIGGLTFLILKGALKIYLRKSQYIRYSQRMIKNYIPITRIHSDSTNSNNRDHSDQGDSTGVVTDEGDSQSSSSLFDNGQVRQSLDDDDSDEDIDSDDQTPRTRPVFSMTISLGG